MRTTRASALLAASIVCILLISFREWRNGDDDRTVKFSFTLKQDASTSAGVFAADSTLVRTLWGGVKYTAGTHQSVWDGKNDDGRPLAIGKYQVRVLSNNVKYSWDGIIGNTSGQLTGPTVFNAIRPINGLAIVDHTAYYSVEYNEQGTSMQKFDTRSPLGKKDIAGPGTAAGVVATDGKLVYWAAGGGNKSYFVYATRVADDQVYQFSEGRTAPAKYGRDKLSRVDESIVPDFITGLAVQKNGDHLFTVHPNKNEVRIFNKSTGKFLNSIQLTKPRTIALQGDNEAWITYVDNGKYTAGLFRVKEDGSLVGTNLHISGFARPMTIAVSPDRATVIIADAGDSQQLKGYDTRTGAQKWIFGKEGGYANDPEVRDDKFYFSDKRINYNPGVAFDDDGSFWVEDSGNGRLQHFTADRKFINRVMYIPMSYNIAVDVNDPQRVFSDYLEFRIDYIKPLQPNNGSWTLVRNWGGQVTTDDRYHRLKDMITLGNGRTYALTRDKGDWSVIEMAAKGPIRYTSTTIPKNAGIGADGNVYSMSYVQKGKTVAWSKREFSGFNAQNDPIWKAPVVIARTPPTAEGDIFSEGEVLNFNPATVTSSNVVVYFNGKKAFKATAKPHLGGIKAGTDNWLWQTARGTSLTYGGPFPADGKFDNGNNVKNPGSLARAIGRNIFWGYYGENWKAGQTNKYNHVYDDGLFVGQFGTAGENFKRGMAAAPMMAGNAFSFYVVRTKTGDVYLYHNDESVHGGVHRWHISDLNSIKEQFITVNLK